MVEVRKYILVKLSRIILPIGVRKLLLLIVLETWSYENRLFPNGVHESKINAFC